MFILLRRSFTERPFLRQERPSRVRIVCDLAGCFGLCDPFIVCHRINESVVTVHIDFDITFRAHFDGLSGQDRSRMVDRNTRFDRSEIVTLSAPYVISINTFGKRSSVDTLSGKGIIPVIVFYWTNRRFFVDVAEQLDVIAARHSDNDAVFLAASA